MAARSSRKLTILRIFTAGIVRIAESPLRAIFDSWMGALPAGPSKAGIYFLESEYIDEERYGGDRMKAGK
jgi:hypothetical protein